jgi:hypothetical protein
VIEVVNDYSRIKIPSGSSSSHFHANITSTNNHHFLSFLLKKSKISVINREALENCNYKGLNLFNERSLKKSITKEEISESASATSRI